MGCKADKLSITSTYYHSFYLDYVGCKVGKFTVENAVRKNSFISTMWDVKIAKSVGLAIGGLVLSRLCGM